MQASSIYFSNFERREDDNYPTIDTRCVDGLLACVPICGTIVDPCSTNGSAIVDYLLTLGKNAFGLNDAFATIKKVDCIVTNPPFTKNKVNQIVWKQIQRIEDGEAILFALLVRINWDFAKIRRDMFVRHSYRGQVKLLFRPWWTEARDQEPKHNYVWHLWEKDGWARKNIWYYLPPYDPQYAVRKHAGK